MRAKGVLVLLPESVVIRGDVRIGDGVVVEPYAVITGPCVIEDGVYIGAHAVVGAAPQHHGSYPSPLGGVVRDAHGVRVGRGATIREFVTIHQGVVSQTSVGEDALVMAGCHVSHDSRVGDRVTLGSFSVLGGFTMIDQDATLGQAVVTHPWILIGEAAMVGLNSSVVKDVLPFAKVAGAPARILGSNTHRDESLPAAYDEAVVASDVWDRWGGLVECRAQLRDAYRSAA